MGIANRETLTSHFLIPVENDLAHVDVQTITKASKRGTERSEIDLSGAKAPQGDRRSAGSTAESAEEIAEFLSGILMPT